MKIILPILSLIIFQITICSSDTILIAIIDGKMTINQQTFSEQSTVDDFSKILGQPSRTKTSPNGTTIFTFDDRGIYLYRYANKNNMRSVNIQFTAGRFDFCPYACFNGTFSLDGKSISTETKSDDLINNPNLNFVQVRDGIFKIKYHSDGIMFNFTGNSTISDISYVFKPDD